MPNVRKPTQRVDAFSLPVSLSEEAKASAASRGMTYSGFYRYCLAKELGYSEQQAIEFSMHTAIVNSIRASQRRYAENKPDHFKLNESLDANSAEAVALGKTSELDVAGVPPTPAKSPKKLEAPAPTAHKPSRGAGAQKGSSVRPVLPKPPPSAHE